MREGRRKWRRLILNKPPGSSDCIQKNYAAVPSLGGCLRPSWVSVGYFSNLILQIICARFMLCLGKRCK